MRNSLKPQLNRTQEVVLSENANIAWSSVFALVAIVIVAVNALTIMAFTTILISLAIADMMVGAVAIPLYIYLTLKTGLQKGAVQNLFEAVDILWGLASVFTLTIISDCSPLAGLCCTAPDGNELILVLLLLDVFLP